VRAAGGRKRLSLAKAPFALILCALLSTACVSVKVDRGGDDVPASIQQELTYKNDDRTAFMAPQITYGLRDIKARYARSYFKDGKPKAQLSYGDLKFRKLGAKNVLMTGRWYLTDADGKRTEGYYTLIWENTSDGWKMIHDHSS
jgi:hypothetical protein